MPDLFPVLSGCKTNRDTFLVDIDLDRLKSRMADYFNPNLSHEEITALSRRHEGHYVRSVNAVSVREARLARGSFGDAGYLPYTLSALRHPVAILGIQFWIA